MSNNEVEGVVVEEHGVLEKFEGEVRPENVVERIYVVNGEIVKQEWLENGEVVRTETVKEVD
jgi:sRNA-binding regulator protein Hfq